MAKTAKKLSMEELIARADAAKKANPLDLSSDQDLSIALMNLISLEEHFFFSGGKTGKTGFYDLINVVREMRKDLMSRIVNKSTEENGEVWCVSKHLLAASMRLMEVGTKALGAGKKADATDLFTRAYELYSLFWGINMNLVDLTGVKMIENKMEISIKGCGCESPLSACELDYKKAAEPVVAKGGAAEKSAAADKKSLLSGLGAWVKKSVNCCIE